MPDFSLISSIPWQPFVCQTCGTHVGPYVALNIEFADSSNVGLCANCVMVAGRLVGMSDAEHVQGLEQNVRVLHNKNVELADLLEKASNQQVKVVSLKEAMNEIQKQPALTGTLAAELTPEPHPAEPKAEPVTAATTGETTVTIEKPKNTTSTRARSTKPRAPRKKA